MKKDTLIWSLLIVLCIILIYCQFQNNRVQVEIDNRRWNVIESYPNRVAAAELLSEVNSRIINYMRYLKIKYHINETEDVIHREGDLHTRVTSGDTYMIVNTLLTNYNPDVFNETDPKTTDETSWTINKGDAMFICIRDKKDPTKLVSPDLVLFVMLHESAHIANYNGWGHPKRFWEVFKFLLWEAENAGIMHNVDFSIYPADYCGLHIDYNPLFDNNLRNLWELNRPIAVSLGQT
jgi:hypothetical protein